MFGAGTRSHNEHMAMEQHEHIWHVQDLTTTETSFTLQRGLSRGLGLTLMWPVRHVTSRIRFQDSARRPIPAQPQEIHHRNETLVGTSDPWALVETGRTLGSWSLAARAGFTMPLGRTEANPFALGRLGRPHQHIQFGTGTWDPLLGLSAGRRVGDWTLAVHSLARLTLYENANGYRAGDRYFAGASVERRLGSLWRATAGADVGRERAERWDGRVEEEGNLGRTDVLASVGILRLLGRAGAVGVTVKVPLLTKVSGAQLDYPAVIVLGWTR